jgi:hypothetical protein
MQSSMKVIIRTIFSPLLDYAQGIAKAGNPTEASNYIIFLEGNPEAATKLMVGSVFLTSVADLIILGSGGLSISVSSMANDLILSLILFLLMLDSGGKVVRSKIIAHRLNGMKDAQAERRMVRLGTFTAAAPYQPEYREIFYSHKTTKNTVIDPNHAEREYIPLEEF